jgi:hypothetical protein
MRHITGFYSHGTPKLVLREDEAVNTLTLSGNLGFELSENRYCIGFRRSGRDYPCPDEAVTKALQCQNCRRTELSCARCRGERCLLGFGECVLGEHCVYLASFGGVLKAGVTTKERLVERLAEQGADFGARIASGRDGLEARAAEGLIQHQFGFRNAMRTSEKIRLFSIGKEKARRALEDALREVCGFPGMEPGEVLDLSAFYPDFLGSPPVSEEFSGQVLGAKGNVLFVRQEGMRIIDMGKIVGRCITQG